MLNELVCARQTYDVAFQGCHGAYSEEAAVQLLASASELMPCPRLEDVFDAVHDGTARYGVIPVENSLAGSVHRSYDLLSEYDLTIVGETVCRLDHALIGVPDAKLDRIRKALSHPTVLAQCERFFRQNPSIEPVSVYDTAGAVQTIVRAGDDTSAAIASTRAAELWGGVVLTKSVEDDPENYTRFLLISKPMEMERPHWLDYKRTIAFRIVNEPGALCRALLPFADRGIDIAKIESRPVKGSPFEYMFYLDLVGSADFEQMYEAVEELRRQALSLRVLGMYRAYDPGVSKAT
jgi:prephenate dehydratase